ncbi:MAG: PPOX class F420-dependent oxidoreductase [Anaerolineae bacterium]|nr:PPOX class F420-dependent oxidoreductase [Anaerolineae bacterium]
MAAVIPDSHRDLLSAPNHGVLTTLMPDGQPQSSLVWIDYDGTAVRINTTRERQKGKNLLANPRATLLVIDRENAGRFIEIRGEVEIVEEGALEHLNEITARYTTRTYYGDIFPPEKQYQETRIICKLHPVKVNVDAIHS